MIYTEIVVNVPIRRTYSKRHNESQVEAVGISPGTNRGSATARKQQTIDRLQGLAALETMQGGSPEGDEPAMQELVNYLMDDVPIELRDDSLIETLQNPQTAAPEHQIKTFHYHVPTELESVIQPGHLVWVPFGHRQVQGIVVRITNSSPVPTKPIDRLNRKDPVLTEAQIALAIWMSSYYVIPVSETVKLFLPPGLLVKEDGTRRVRAKREIQIELLIEPDTIDTHLRTLGRETPMGTILAWFLAHPQETPQLTELQKNCQLKSASSIQTLIKHGTLQNQDGEISLGVSVEEAEEKWLSLRGTAKYEPILRVLADADTPLWKSDLYAQHKTTLEILREMQKAGLIGLTEHIRFRDPLAGKTYPQTTAPPFTEEQQAAWQSIHEQGFCRPDPTVAAKFLLHGVTGSGKTEVFLKAIAQTLAEDGQAIVLVPEIALTPQTVARFAGRFPGRVTVIHSKLSQGERYDVWRHIQEGEFDVVVGPRSALFAPLPRLGLIIIDEEHESSYKQNAEAWGSHTVFYHACRLADELANLTKSVLILGSATPSLTSYYAMEQGHYQLLEMSRRVMGRSVVKLDDDENTLPVYETIYAEMPPVDVVDMRQELRAGNRSVFSRTLSAALHNTLDKGEQAILFLNRRGTSSFVLCRDCGHVSECDRCDTPLTYHERVNFLICHRCNRRFDIPEVCPECESKRIKYFGSGTQKLAEMVTQVAPKARLMRWDADTTKVKGSHEALLEHFANQEADVLVGTQMIAKGLDLPMVTLVGVIAADIGLHLPDFHSSERTFQLLTLVVSASQRINLAFGATCVTISAS
ncbi:MAG: primosomal protein N', partial [Chloroflexota bacterium]